MMFVALGMVAAASYYYPWPTQQQTVNKVNEPLFAEYSTDAVVAIQIQNFEFVDSRNGVMQQFGLRRQNKQWLMVDRANYPAGNFKLIADARNSLNNLLIEELTTDDRKDYGLYGVHDPGGDAPSGKGTLLQLRSASGESVAALIVGESPEGRQDQKYVRIPDQPQVYLVAFNDQILSTEFSSWVSTDLMRLPVNEAKTLQSFRIENYIADRDGFAKNGSVNYRYTAALTNNNQRWQGKIRTANDAGELPDGSKTLRIPQTERSWFGQLAGYTARTPYSNVKPKQDLVASHLATPDEKAKPIEFSSMLSSGFHHSGYKNGQHQFVSSAGHFSLLKANAVRQTIFFGNLADAERGGSGELARYAFLLAEFDPEELPEPKKIQTDDPDEQRSYEEALQNWKIQRDKAIANAAEFNRHHSKWFYVVPESVYQGFVPSSNTLLSKSE